jgi:hypothetical protein
MMAATSTRPVPHTYMCAQLRQLAEATSQLTDTPLILSDENITRQMRLSLIKRFLSQQEQSITLAHLQPQMHTDELTSRTTHSLAKKLRDDGTSKKGTPHITAKCCKVICVREVVSVVQRHDSHITQALIHTLTSQ